MGRTSPVFASRTRSPKSRSGARAASSASERRSDIENVAVAFTIRSRSLCVSACETPPCEIRRRSMIPRACESGSGMRMRRGTLLSKASSRSQGLFVAPMKSNLWSVLVATPSSCTKNSVFSLREASCSPLAPLWPSRASSSSRKTTLGLLFRPTANSAFTSFSPSPTHFEVSDDAETAKNVHEDSPATALASKVLPVPGGPKRSTPRGGARRPKKRSGRSCGSTTASWSVRLASSRPAMSIQRTPEAESSISERICSSSLASSLLAV
mmetsp:Transcript_20227/g.69691  ORF Transcript_20227/g.69691 Transcript_20227/m.69691 type:complete len:268 (-) Transcript_20227:45-848(-)